MLRPVQNFPDRYFNPRSHEGSDPKGRGTYRRGYISILAPTRGATAIDPQLNNQYRFQSSLPRGERPNLSLNSSNALAFQSSLPRGERRYSYLVEQLPFVFQSSLPRGERRRLRLLLPQAKRFQSSLPRGERPVSGVSKKLGAKISILAPTRGATVKTVRTP